jgi:hypothetical protein
VAPFVQQRTSANLDSDDEELVKLLEDMYKWSISVDGHFLEICQMSMRYDSRPPGVTEQDVDKFTDSIESKKSSSESVNTLDGYAEMVRSVFCDTSYITRLWAPVISRLADGIPEIAQFNNKPPWTTWVIKLDNICVSLPDLVVRMQKIFSELEDDVLDDFWLAVQEKVAFIDQLLLYAYTNEYAAWPRRACGIGKAINTKIDIHSRFGTQVEQFREFETPRYLADKSDDPATLGEVSGIVKHHYKCRELISITF